MTNLFLFTASNSDAQVHWRHSILKPVDPALVWRNFPSEQQVELKVLADANNGFYCWGATPGDQNVPTWERMEVGDYVIGYYKNYYRCVASVMGKYHNRSYASELWGHDPENKTWEYMYFLSKPVMVEIFKDAPKVKEILGGAPQGFRRVADERILNARRLYGSVTEFLDQCLINAEPDEPLDPGTGAVSLPKKSRQEEINEQLKKAASIAAGEGEFDPTDDTDARDKTFRAVVTRRGQPEFRKRLLLAYGEQCAVTGSDCPEALEAAHILPYKGEHTNHVSNGLLLRSDIHTLFDLGLLAIHSATMKVVLAPSLINSKYGFLNGRELKLPISPEDHPNKVALAQHQKEADI